MKYSLVKTSLCSAVVGFTRHACSLFHGEKSYFLPYPRSRNDLRRVDQDLLLSHSAPALMRTYPDKLESRETYLEPGQLIVWRWLSMDRFFPPSEGDSRRQTILRGCASVSPYFIPAL